MGTKELRQGSHLLVRDNFMVSEARKKQGEQEVGVG